MHTHTRMSMLGARVHVCARAHVSMRTTGRGGGREAGGGGGREKRPDDPRFGNSALTGATFQKDARGGQRVGSERGSGHVWVLS